MRCTIAILCCWLVGCNYILPIVEKPNTKNTQGKIYNPVSNGNGAILTPAGEPLQIQYPGPRHKRNTAGIDGKGLCVFASMSHTGDWQSDELFNRMHKYMESHPGGGYPEKVDAMVKRAATELGLPIPKYIQIQDTDIDIIKQALKNGYMPCITYGISPTGRYGGKTIAHMVNTVHGKGDTFAVLDNNFPGDNQLEFMNENQFKRAYTALGGKGWCIILLTNPPPPLPK